MDDRGATAEVLPQPAPSDSEIKQVGHGVIRKGPDPQFIEVRFKGKRRDFYATHVEPPLSASEFVVVEADRGQDLGLVTAIGSLAKRKCFKSPWRR